jgi:hypothetical protein
MMKAIRAPVIGCHFIGPSTDGGSTRHPSHLDTPLPISTPLPSRWITKPTPPSEVCDVYGVVLRRRFPKRIVRFGKTVNEHRYMDFSQNAPGCRKHTVSTASDGGDAVESRILKWSPPVATAAATTLKMCSCRGRVWQKNRVVQRIALCASDVFGSDFFCTSEGTTQQSRSECTSRP